MGFRMTTACGTELLLHRSIKRRKAGKSIDAVAGPEQDESGFPTITNLFAVGHKDSICSEFVTGIDVRRVQK